MKIELWSPDHGWWPGNSPTYARPCLKVIATCEDLSARDLAHMLDEAFLQIYGKERRTVWPPTKPKRKRQSRRKT